jgi:hypothetical protein
VIAVYCTFDRRDVARSITLHRSFGAMRAHVRAAPDLETFQALIPEADFPGTSDELVRQLVERITRWLMVMSA